MYVCIHVCMYTCMNDKRSLLLSRKYVVYMIKVTAIVVEALPVLTQNLWVINTERAWICI